MASISDPQLLSGLQGLVMAPVWEVAARRLMPKAVRNFSDAVRTLLRKRGVSSGRRHADQTQDSHQYQLYYCRRVEPTEVRDGRVGTRTTTCEAFLKDGMPGISWE